MLPMTEDSIQQKIGKRVKKARIKSGLSAREVAQRCKVHLREYQRWESRVPPDMRASTIERLAQALGVSERYLFTF